MTSENYIVPYRRLTKALVGTRKTLWQVCRELDIDMNYLDPEHLETLVVNCSHCGIWGTDHQQDADDFPVCRICLRLVGR
jgi:hypothetical protein